ncbi:MAG: hypothetical protein ABJP93_05685, partial [Marinobacter sp.]|uniref:hypothetical protein n=1 Tax=Marinobacter sp. TaxID=50741 RepID=UPI003299FADB
GTHTWCRRCPFTAGEVMVSAWVRRASRECYRRDGKFKRTAVGQSIGSESPWLTSIGVGVSSRSVAHTRRLGARRRPWGNAVLGWENRHRSGCLATALSASGITLLLRATVTRLTRVRAPSTDTAVVAMVSRKIVSVVR